MRSILRECFENSIISKGVCRCILVAFIALRRVYSFFITRDGDFSVRGYFLFAEKNKSFSEKFLTFTGKIVRFTGRIRVVYIYKKKKWLIYTSENVS